MARRPVFCIHDLTVQGPPYVDVVMVDFKWYPGISKLQKQKSIESLHAETQKCRSVSVLEVSTKSMDDLGVRLSAFNLGFTHPKRNIFISVESAFQGSKVFDSDGPFHELYEKTSKEAKSFHKDKSVGSVLGFNFFGQTWPASPKNLFYDWLYLNCLYRSPEIAEAVLKYECFTDIEFNPKKSLNCQAYSAALFVSLSKRGIIDDVLASKEIYLNLFKDSDNWIDSSEYMRYHQP